MDRAACLLVLTGKVEAPFEIHYSDNYAKYTLHDLSHGLYMFIELKISQENKTPQPISFRQVTISYFCYIQSSITLICRLCS